MTAIHKFLFDTIFDDPEESAANQAAAEAEVEEVAPTFSEEDLNGARAEGFAAGREAAVQEAANAVERRIMETLGMIGERLSELFRIQEEANAAAVQNAVTVAATIARKVFPDLSRRNALGEVEMVAEEAMALVTDEPRIIMHVNEQLRDSLAARLDALGERYGFTDKVILRADPEIPLGDCRVEWSTGGSERNTADLWRDIDEIIAHNLGTDVAAMDGFPDAEVAAVPADSGPQPTTVSTPESGEDEGQPAIAAVEDGDLDPAPAADMTAGDTAPAAPQPADGGTDTTIGEAAADGNEETPGAPAGTDDTVSPRPPAPDADG